MSETEILPAPDVSMTANIPDKWDLEYRAFLRLKPSLLQEFADRYVAVHEEQVVDSGEDKLKLGLRVYHKFGYVPIFFGLVSASTDLLVRIPSPRLLTAENT
jgi:hypothetical protein